MNDTQIELTAACAFGLESIVRRELKTLGIDATVPQNGRIDFRGSLRTICETNLWLRTADRVLIRIAEFPAADFDALFETTRSLPWGQWIPSEGSFPVTGRSIKSTLTSVPAIQRSVKRAIVEALMRDHAVTSLPESDATYRVDVAIRNDTALLTLDTTGRSLHRRGYRTHISSAPLKETLAAAMVMLSYWRPDRPLIDPFCGSGTIPIEAAMIGRNLAPGLHREFPSQDWPCMPVGIWDEAREAARDQATDSLQGRLIGSDIDPRVLQAARDNAQRAGVIDDIHFQVKPVESLSSRRRFGCLITNPPYGQRLGEWPEVAQLYRTLPDVLRRLPTWSHYILTAAHGFEELVGRKADRRRKLYNGRIECTYYQFHGPKPVTNAAIDDQLAAIPGPSDQSPEAVATEAVATEAVTTGTMTTETLTTGTATTGTATTGTATGAKVTSATDHGATAMPSAGQPDSAAVDRSKRPVYVHASGPAAFGQLDEKAKHQAELFSTRLQKRARHLRRWPTRRNITCFRLYDRDIPEIPLVVDRYEDYLHMTEYDRPHDRDPAQHGNWLDLMVSTAAETLQIPNDHVFLKRRERQRGKKQHDRLADDHRIVEVGEGGLRFLVNLSDYVDTGLFLDHRITRDMVRSQSKDASFLNLFCYTGSFTTYAASGGAKQTVSVDLSKTYLDWAQQNLKLNDLAGSQHRFINSDVIEFLDRHPKRPTYDLAVVDPPTFSNSKRISGDWKIQDHAVELLNRLMPLMHERGVVYFSTNFRRFRFDAESIHASQIYEISKQTVPEDFRNRRIHRCWRIIK